jgi:hypothetical protein
MVMHLPLQGQSVRSCYRYTSCVLTSLRVGVFTELDTWYSGVKRSRSCGMARLYTVVTQLLTRLCTTQIQGSYHSYTLFIVCVLILFVDVHVTYALENWLRQEGRGFDSRWGNCNFSLVQSFRPRYGLGVDSASNRTECQEYFL